LSSQDLDVLSTPDPNRSHDPKPPISFPKAKPRQVAPSSKNSSPAGLEQVDCDSLIVGRPVLNRTKPAHLIALMQGKATTFIRKQNQRDDYEFRCPLTERIPPSNAFHNFQEFTVTTPQPGQGNDVGRLSRCSQLFYEAPLPGLPTHPPLSAPSSLLRRGKRRPAPPRKLNKKAITNDLQFIGDLKIPYPLRTLKNEGSVILFWRGGVSTPALSGGSNHKRCHVLRTTLLPSTVPRPSKIVPCPRLHDKKSAFETPHSKT